MFSISKHYKGNVQDSLHLYHYFTEKQWNDYPFVSEKSLEWFRDSKYGIFSKDTVLCGINM